MNYCTIINSVIQSPTALPFRHRLADGSTRTSLSELSESELLALGFYLVDETRPELTAGKTYGTPELTLTDNRVTAVYPLIDAPIPAPMSLTQLAFLRRFTTGERIVIRASADPVIQDFMHLVALAQDILVTDSDTQMGIGYLAQQGLIAPERVAEILA